MPLNIYRLGRVLAGVAEPYFATLPHWEVVLEGNDVITIPTKHVSVTS